MGYSRQKSVLYSHNCCQSCILMFSKDVEILVRKVHTFFCRCLNSVLDRIKRSVVCNILFSYPALFPLLCFLLSEYYFPHTWLEWKSWVRLSNTPTPEKNSSASLDWKLKSCKISPSFFLPSAYILLKCPTHNFILLFYHTQLETIVLFIFPENSSAPEGTLLTCLICARGSTNHCFSFIHIEMFLARRRKSDVPMKKSEAYHFPLSKSMPLSLLHQ